MSTRKRSTSKKSRKKKSTRKKSTRKKSTKKSSTPSRAKMSRMSDDELLKGLKKSVKIDKNLDGKDPVGSFNKIYGEEYGRKN